VHYSSALCNAIYNCSTYLYALRQGVPSPLPSSAIEKALTMIPLLRRRSHVMKYEGDRGKL